MKRLLFPVLCSVAIVGACAADDPGPSEAQRRERELAAREACIATRLFQQAQDELATLQSLNVVTGPVAFQQAYVQHAELRLSSLAHLDSALNHSASPADSARHQERSAAIQIRAPDVESVEANVIRSYEAKAAAIASDADHPCNWQSELDNRD